MMFFARPGTYKPCGIYTIGHFVLLAIVTLGVIVALKYTKNKSSEEVKKIYSKHLEDFKILEKKLIKDIPKEDLEIFFKVISKMQENIYITLYRINK